LQDSTIFQAINSLNCGDMEKLCFKKDLKLAEMERRFSAAEKVLEGFFGLLDLRFLFC